MFTLSPMRSAQVAGAGFRENTVGKTEVGRPTVTAHHMSSVCSRQ
jgi:hypothetical protein